VIYDKEGHASPSSMRNRRKGGRAEYDREAAGARVRARFVDQGELTRPPGEGRRHDPTPPPSPGELGTGSPSAGSTESGREDETATGPRPKKYKRGRRAPQPLPNQRKASREEDREERGAPPNRGWGGRTEGP